MIPTRIRRWLETDAGRQYIIIPRATFRALVRIYDWTRARLAGVSWPVLTDLAATTDDLAQELDDLRAWMNDNEED